MSRRVYAPTKARIAFVVGGGNSSKVVITHAERVGDENYKGLVHFVTSRHNHGVFNTFTGEWDWLGGDNTTHFAVCKELFNG